LESTYMKVNVGSAVIELLQGDITRDGSEAIVDAEALEAFRGALAGLDSAAAGPGRRAAR
jgi:hypothetical protein